MANRADFFHSLADQGFGLMALDYRGYGASEGSPSEAGFYQDASAAINYTTHTLAVLTDRIILYGESIGTGVAVQMATEFPEAALVLQSPYTSTEAVAEQRYPWLPVHFLMKDRFDSLSKMKNVHVPLLLMHGEQDVIVPVSEGKKLFAGASEPKTAIYFPQKGHNDLDSDARITALINFSHRYNLIKE